MLPLDTLVSDLWSENGDGNGWLRETTGLVRADRVQVG